MGLLNCTEVIWAQWQGWSDHLACTASQRVGLVAETHQAPATYRFDRRGVIDKSVLDTLIQTVLHGGSFTAVAAGIADACKQREQRHRQLYMDFQLSQQQPSQQAMIPVLPVQLQPEMLSAKQWVLHPMQHCTSCPFCLYYTW